MRRISLLLFLFLLICPLAFADDTGYDICYEDFMEYADASGKPMLLYTGRTVVSLNMRSRPDKGSASLGVIKERGRVYIFGFDQQWLFCWDDEVGVYYIGRHNVDEITPLSEDIPPYGVIKNRFIATTARETALLVSPEMGAEALGTYPAGTRMSLWLIRDGWAVVPYNRLVGYVYVGDLTDLTPVAPSIEDAEPGDILAAFTTFYSTKTTELNLGRMENMRVGCEYIDQTYEPGYQFDFNNVAGPYRYSRGYKDAPVLIDGQTVGSAGGGTCHVSTTLYNVLLQISDGIEIIWRRPHGPGGAKYAPHGVDAAVGAENLNLEFENDFDFPITIQSTVHSGALCICILKGAY